MDKQKAIKTIIVFLIIELIMGLLFAYYYEFIKDHDSGGSLFSSILNYFTEFHFSIGLFILLGNLLLYLVTKRLRNYFEGLVVGLSVWLLNIIVALPFSNSDIMVTIGLIFLPVISLSIAFKAPLFSALKNEVDVAKDAISEQT